jgi:hypothetical protein
MAAAFTDPIPAAKPLGFRFTVGGGKKVSRNCCAATVVPMVAVAAVYSSAVQVRAKYGEDMPKWCREALRSIGFEEDRWRAMRVFRMRSSPSYGLFQGRQRCSRVPGHVQDAARPRQGWLLHHWHHWHTSFSHECLQMHLRSHPHATPPLHYAARDARPRRRT